MPSTYEDRLTGITTSVAVKAPCRAATTANITLSGLQTIDGVSLASGDRVLVKNQSTPSQNGIYDADTSAWTRALDFDGTRDAVTGTTVQVIAGTVNQYKWFNVTTANPITIGTSSLTFAETYVSLSVVGAVSASETQEGTVELATIAETRIGTDPLRVPHVDAIASLWQKGSDIVSATTLSKPASANLGGYHDITGVTTIAGMWTGESSGMEYTFQFDSALQLTNSSSFILPSAANITTATGDVAVFRAEQPSDIWRCISYTKVNGTPIRITSSYGSAAEVLTSNGAGSLPTFQALPGGASIPSGVIVPYGGRTAPSGWQLCYGQAISRATYATLFGIICGDIGTFTASVVSPTVITLNSHGLRTGDRIRLKTSGTLPTGLALVTDYYVSRIDANTFNVSLTQVGTLVNVTGAGSGTHTAQDFAYGAGDGSTTFNTPDLRGRVPAGSDALGGTAASRLTSAGSLIYGEGRGAFGGTQTHTMSTAEMPAHTHVIQSGNGSGSLASSLGNSNADTVTDSAGSGGAHQNTQPTIIFTYIIKE